MYGRKISHKCNYVIFSVGFYVICAGCDDNQRSQMSHDNIPKNQSYQYRLIQNIKVQIFLCSVFIIRYLWNIH